jgi:L-iditol 2-dehydrogenase
MILGHEFSGTVAEPPAGSSRFHRGDPVAILPLIPCGRCPGCRAGEPFHCTGYSFLGSRIDGGFAEYCAVPEANLFPLPPGVDLRVGAFIEPIAVALHAVRRSGFWPGQSALVLGAGSIGILIGLWLRVFAASRVVMADLRAESLATAARVGLGETMAGGAGVPPAGTAPSGAAASGAALAAEPFDHAFEAAGAAAALLSAVEAVRDKGTTTVVGRDTRDTLLPLASFEKLMRKEIDLRGCWGYNMTGEEEFLFDRLRRGSFPVEELVTHQVSLAEAPETVGAMLGGQMYTCKVLVDVAQEGETRS